MASLAHSDVKATLCGGFVRQVDDGKLGQSREVGKVQEAAEWSASCWLVVSGLKLRGKDIGKPIEKGPKAK